MIIIKLPLIQLIPSNNLDKFAIWEFLKKDNYITKNYNGCILELCNCFGFRQKYNKNVKSRVVNIIKNSIEGSEIEVSSSLAPWVFSEDIASLLWFILETKYTGYIKMPSLGHMTLKEIAEITLKTLNKNNHMKEIDIDLETQYKYTHINEWIPDSISLEKSLQKTINWYNVNRWAIL